jgi:hypothetical protein
VVLAFSGALPALAATVVNDDCSGAIALTENVYFGVNTDGATDDGLSSCLGTNRSKGVWFTYTPIQTSTAIVDTCPSDFDTILEIFTGTCGALTSIDCNDDSCNLQAACAFACTAGTTYYIWAGGFDGVSGNLQIRARVVAPPANDLCGGAIPLAENVYFAQSTTNATDDDVSSCLNDKPRGKGVWFTYTPVRSGTAVVDTCPADFDTLLEIFTGTCGALASIGCNDDSSACSGHLQSSLSFPCTAATTYFICAGGFTGESGNLSIRAALIPRRPALSLALGAGNLQLTIHGDAGHVHDIQQTGSLTAPDWQTVQPVTLSSDPQTIPLALPAVATFWRVVAH